MNNITIKGRISRDVELKTTTTGKEVANFSVAINRRFDKETTDFFEVQAWGKTGVFVNTYFTKGQEILIQGAMQCRKWQDNDGNNRYNWELVADQVEFCGSKGDVKVTHSQNIDDYVELADDDDCPF